MSKHELVINYVPGEECRVAVLQEGRLEELHAERMDSVSHVGNIYVGKVVNVEPNIQAAFVDFGLEHNGFLHISDLHPRYFPGEDREETERVGKKTPRRDRPPMQECLRRGQEIAVQVLKEGVGTKGPTVTSYLSIPGRFLVMMPQMDRVGVSRKVEDEELRRKMREILDQLELPDGFGFILRTAGMDRNKTELKRDLAYLQRLWKDIEKRWKTGGGKPRLLYSESDLLVRALRDILTSDVERIVVDSEHAVQRASRFLKIVAPRSSTKLVRFTGIAPIFHAMGIEEQIQLIHAREVPLPSGGRLVIDETEALVAIDVNSGRSRDARDAETNAFRTNQEACDEICRQLRLRDLGGIVINDLIDMRSLRHRREIEQRFRDNLKRDRARTTIESISQFGILEMTRQRMRGSHESVHFGQCPTCRGRGLVQRADSVAADALRDMAAVLDSDRVARVEMVVNPRIAGELLSGKRRALSRIEKMSGKHADVRVSEAVAIDRVTFYAYDERGADVDVSKLPRRRVREDELVVYEVSSDAVDNWAEESQEAPEIEEAHEVPAQEPIHPIEIDIEGDAAGWTAESAGAEGGPRAGGRRRRRRGRGRGKGDSAPEPRSGGPQGARDGANAPTEANTGNDDTDAPAPQPRGAGDSAAHPGETEEGTGRRRRRRRRRGRGGAAGVGEQVGEGEGESQSGDAGRSAETSVDDSPDSASTEHHSEDGFHGGDSQHEAAGPDAPADGGRRRRRRRRRRGRGSAAGGPGSPELNGALMPDGTHSPHPVDAPDESNSEAEQNHAEPSGQGESPSEPETADGAEGVRRRRRRRRGRGGRGGAAPGGDVPADKGEAPSRPKPARQGNVRPAPPPPPPSGAKGGSAARAAAGSGESDASRKPRTLYSTRRRLSPGELRGKPKED